MKKIIFFALMLISSQMLSAKSEAALNHISPLMSPSVKNSSFLSYEQILRKHSHHRSSHCSIPGPQGPQGLAPTTVGAYVVTTSTETGVRGNVFNSSLNPINPTSFGGANFFFDSNNNGFIAIPVHGFYLVAYGLSTDNNTEYHLETLTDGRLLQSAGAAAEDDQLGTSTVIVELKPQQVGLTLAVGEGLNAADLDVIDGGGSIPASMTAFLSMTLLQEISP